MLVACRLAGLSALALTTSSRRSRLCCIVRDPMVDPNLITNLAERPKYGRLREGKSERSIRMTSWMRFARASRQSEGQRPPHPRPA